MRISFYLKFILEFILALIQQAGVFAITNNKDVLDSD